MKKNNEIFFGRDLHTAKFVGIIFQGCSYITTSNFLNIIKNKYMCEKISMAKISEILDSFGCECLGLDHLDGYSEFKKIPYDIGFIFNKQKGGENNMIKLLPNPKRVICSGPVTTVIYGDGSKTHIRKTEDDQNDYEKAFLLSWLYKTYGKTIVNKKLDKFKEEFNKEVDSTNSKEDVLAAFSAEKVSERLNSALTKGI